MTDKLIQIFFNPINNWVAIYPWLEPLNTVDNGQLIWLYKKYLSLARDDFFKHLLRKQKTIELNYRVICATLIKQIKQQKLIDDKRFVQQLIIALVMAETLEYLCHYYLARSNDAKKIQHEQRQLQYLLQETLNLKFKEMPLYYPLSFHEYLRHKITHSIWPRLFLFRGRNCFAAGIACIQHTSSMYIILQKIDKIFYPIIYSFGWILHGNRLLINLSDIVIHAVPGFWISPHEKSLSVFVRLELQLKRHWLEIILDITKIIDISMPANIPLTLIVTISDIFTIGLPRILEIIRLKKLQSALLKDKDDDTQDYLLYINARLEHERIKLIIGFLNTVSVNALNILKLSLPFLLTSLIIHPIIPFVITSLIVTLTVTFYLLNSWVDKRKPIDKFDEKATLKKPLKPSSYSTGLTHFHLKKSNRCLTAAPTNAPLPN